jgi:hypothetical protein
MRSSPLTSNYFQTKENDEMSTNRRHNRPWTRHDLKRMRSHARARLSARQSAQRLGRSTGSVKYKAMVVGVRFRHINQPKGVQRRPAVRRKIARAKRA